MNSKSLASWRSRKKLLNSTDIYTPQGVRSFELWKGDITRLGFPIDLLMVSAVGGHFSPFNNTVIGALSRKLGISVKNLSEEPDLDFLQPSFRLWVSKNVDPKRIGRIMCLEIPYGGAWGPAEQGRPAGHPPMTCICPPASRSSRTCRHHKIVLTAVSGPQGRYATGPYSSSKSLLISSCGSGGASASRGCPAGPRAPASRTPAARDSAPQNDEGFVPDAQKPGVCRDRRTPPACICPSCGHGALSDIVGESMLIIGWVAMWRPLEIFLYEWVPLRRRCRILAKLSKMPVIVQPKSAVK
jgi:hypothetical protein